MAAEKIIKAAQVAISVLKDKKTRRVILVTLVIILFLIVMIPVVIGIAAVTALAGVVNGICSFLGTGVTPDQLPVEQMIEAFDSGYTLSRDQEMSLRMTGEDFKYMLVRINEYNHAGERERTVTIEGRYEYDEEYDEEDEEDEEDDGFGPYYDDGTEDVPDENDDRTTDPGALTGEEVSAEEDPDERGAPPEEETDGEYSEEDSETDNPETDRKRRKPEKKRETPTREVILKNDYIEGISEYDYRIFYTFLAMAASDRESSDRALSGVVPLDSNFQVITSGEDRESSSDVLVRNGYMITRNDIDKVFTYTSMDYGAYYFDGVRDKRETYTFEECKSLPHITEETEEDGGTVTWCIPYSYIKGGQSSYSVLEAVKNEDGTVLAAMKETFSYDSMTDTMKSLCRYADSIDMTYYLKQLPGGEQLVEKLETWKDTDMVLHISRHLL